MAFVGAGSDRTGMAGAGRTGMVGADRTGTAGADRTGMVGAGRTGTAGAGRMRMVGAGRTGMAGAGRSTLVGADRTALPVPDRTALARPDRTALTRGDRTARLRPDETGPLNGDGIDACDVGELYYSLSRRLERIVRAGVQAPDALIEEACQFAWARLVHHRERVRRDTALAWLVKTALREAVKLTGRGRREVSLDAELEERGEIPARGPGPAVVCEQREQLRAVSALSLRQQRLLWLRALGLSYEEIALHDGCTSRTVERELKRGRSTLQAVASGGVRPAPTAPVRAFAGGARLG